MLNLFEPDDFRRDWYGFLTNQMSHTLLGIFIVWIMTVIGYLILGELPYRNMLFALTLVGYILYEIVFQGWRGWDTIEDTLFVAVYGAGGTLIAFTEYQYGSASVIFDIYAALPMLTLVSIHLVLGVLYRIKNNRLYLKARRDEDG